MWLKEPCKATRLTTASVVVRFNHCNVDFWGRFLWFYRLILSRRYDVFVGCSGAWSVAVTCLLGLRFARIRFEGLREICDERVERVVQAELEHDCKDKKDNHEGERRRSYPSATT